MKHSFHFKQNSAIVTCCKWGIVYHFNGAETNSVLKKPVWEPLDQIYQRGTYILSDFFLISSWGWTIKSQNDTGYLEWGDVKGSKEAKEPIWFIYSTNNWQESKPGTTKSLLSSSTI